MATKAKENKEKIQKEALFQGGKVNLKSAARQITKDAVVVETLRTLLKEDKQINSNHSHEDMIDICRKFKIDRKKWNSAPAEKLKEIIEQHFIETCLKGDRLTDLYKQLFNDNKLVFEFTDFVVADDLIPKDEDKTPKDIFYRKETLGTGEYDTDDQGNQLPHDEDFATEVAYEIIHFLTHLSGSGDVFMPNRSPDFNLNTLDNDKIMIRVDLVNPLNLV